MNAIIRLPDTEKYAYWGLITIFIDGIVEGKRMNRETGDWEVFKTGLEYEESDECRCSGSN